MYFQKFQAILFSLMFLSGHLLPGSFQILHFFLFCLLVEVECTIKVLRIQIIKQKPVYQSRQGTRLKNINFSTQFSICVFCSSVKNYSDIFGEMCHVSPPSHTESNSIQFAPFTWSVMTIFWCFALCRFIFILKNGTLKCCNIMLQSNSFIFLLPPLCVVWQ